MPSERPSAKTEPGTTGVAATAAARQRGFTLIEALTVIAVLAISLALAIPNLRSFVVKTKVSGISNEFSSALQQARALAVAKNACVTMCASSNVGSATPPTCTGTAAISDYQNGWIIFRNPICNPAQSNPTSAGGSLLAARQGESNGYQIQPQSAALGSIMFDPRGTAALTAQGLFWVYPPSGSPSSFNRNVCVDVTGRSSVRKYDPTSCL